MVGSVPWRLLLFDGDGNDEGTPMNTHRMISRFRTIGNEIRNHGFGAALHYAYHRVTEHYGDWRWNIRTGRYVPRCELDYADDSPNVEYVASSYGALHSSLAMVPIRPGRSVFVDLGCGMGRAAIVASRYGFRRVLGVEYSPLLAAVARQNVHRAAHRSSCPVEIVHADAQSYPIPDDADVIFMFNPFRRTVLAGVISNIHASLSACPRDIWIIFGTPDDFERQIRGESWIQTVSEHYLCNIRYGIYRCHEEPKREAR
jgi:SAM-dependent methyltransferase